jgi:hypothetical protein
MTRRSRAAGRRSRASSAVSRRNGRWAISERVLTLRVDGDLAIVSRRACSSREMASKVVAMSVNRRALTWATGATLRAKMSSWRKKRLSAVLGLTRLRATGGRYCSSGRAWTMNSLRLAPRPAKPEPKMSRSSCDARRVGASNILKMSSNWTGTLVCEMGIVSPSLR